MREPGFYWRGNRRLAESCNSKDLFHDSFPPRGEGEGRRTEERERERCFDDRWMDGNNFPPTRGNLIMIVDSCRCNGAVVAPPEWEFDSIRFSIFVCLERWSTNDGIEDLLKDGEREKEIVSVPVNFYNVGCLQKTSERRRIVREVIFIVAQRSGSPRRWRGARYK